MEIYCKVWAFVKGHFYIQLLTYTILGIGSSKSDRPGWNSTNRNNQQIYGIKKGEGY